MVSPTFLSSSTYPIATAHLIGFVISRVSRRPWIADFRDPMFDDDFPRDPMQRRAHSRIERDVVARWAVGDGHGWLLAARSRRLLGVGPHEARAPEPTLLQRFFTAFFS